MVALALALAAASLAAGHAHHFTVTQVGLPMEEVVGHGFVRSSTQGEGTVVVALPLETDSLRIQPARLEGRIMFRHEDILAHSRLELRLQAVSAALASFADGSRLVVLTVRVVRSNDPACGVGRVGTLELDDEPSGKDAVRLYLCPTDHEHYYNGAFPARGRVRVSIT